ncbi:MAG: MFS transporter, partial [Gammaproteobacteria bacterium]|nr:MFS transporter [Gammaproteobacteria bacterium]
AMFGAISGQVIVAKLTALQGWQEPYIDAAIFGLLLAATIAILFPRKVKLEGIPLNYMVLTKKVILNPQTWLAGIVGGLLFTPTAVFAMLWGVPYFENKLHLTVEMASHITSTVFFGWMVGAPIAGFIADRLKMCKPVMAISAVFLLLSFIMIVYLPATKEFSIFLMFAVGFFSGVQILSFALAHANNSLVAQGTATGVCNFLIASIVALSTPFSGWLLHLTNHTSHPISNYSLSEYQHALLFVPIALCVSLFLLYFVKEKSEFFEQTIEIKLK